jgi:hypothetical protein
MNHEVAYATTCADRSDRARDAAVALVVVALALVAGAIPVVGPSGPRVPGALPPTFATSSGPSTDDVAPTLGSAPSSPPVAICGNASELTGPSSAPAGAVTVPAGNDSALTASYELAANTTYWLAPGVHTLGTGPYSQFQPDEGDTFLGAPGAIVDGQGLNQFAFTFDPDGSTANVTIEYLTIRNFTSGEGEGVVNQNGEPNWTVEHDTIGPNEFNGSNPGGAGVMLGSGSVVEYNCLLHNGEYGFSSFGGSSNLTLAYNEIAYNDYYGGYDQPGSPIQCGCSGGGKFWISTDATVIDDYVHDNGGVGIWVDTDNAGFLIAHNYLSDNYGEGVIYEISYNGEIENNTFVRNALGGGPLIGGFPDSALYISESGFDARVTNPFHATSFLVYGNVFLDNWAGSSSGRTRTGTARMVATASAPWSIRASSRSRAARRIWPSAPPSTTTTAADGSRRTSPSRTTSSPSIRPPSGRTAPSRTTAGRTASSAPTASPRTAGPPYRRTSRSASTTSSPTTSTTGRGASRRGARATSTTR